VACVPEPLERALGLMEHLNQEATHVFPLPSRVDGELDCVHPELQVDDPLRFGRSDAGPLPASGLTNHYDRVALAGKEPVGCTHACG